MKLIYILLIALLPGNNGMTYVGEKEESDITITEGDNQNVYIFTETYTEVPDYVIDNWSGSDNPNCIVTTTQISITALDTLGRTCHISIIER